MTLARQNAELSQGIDVGSGVLTQTLFVPSDNLVNVSGTITANTGVFDLVEFNNATEIVPTEGQLTWDTTYGTLDIGFTDTYALHVGQETNFRVRNETGGTLYKGQAVAATGVHSDNIRLEIDKYTADGNVREVRFIGLLSEDIGDNGSGYTTNFGYIRGNSTYALDTRGSVESPIAVGDETWTQGDILYVHPTVAGKLTKVEPQHSISVAIVIRVHQTDGVILVRPTSYGHLNDNHDVQINSPTTNDMLVYNSGSGVWINTQISDVVLQGTSGLDIGYQSKASSYGQVAHAAGNFAQDGDAQFSLFVARNNTTDDTANVELFLNGSSERMVIPAESTWTFTINLSAYNDTDNTSAWWIIRGGIRRNAANGTALIGSLITERDYEGAMSGTSAAVTADDTNESLKIAVTGLASKNIRWVAVVDVAQVSWGTP